VKVMSLHLWVSVTISVITGALSLTAHRFGQSDTDTAIGYQLLAGLGYDVSDNLIWDTQYRYLDSGNLDFAGARTNQVFGSSDIIAVGASGVGAHSLMTVCLLGWLYGL